MRIIRIFKDYYDIGVSEGHDKTIIYKRFNEVEIYPKSKRWLKHSKPVSFEEETSEDLQSLGFNYRWVVIGFCGKVFQCLRIEIEIPDPQYPLKRAPTIQTICCYNAAAVRRVFQCHATKKHYKTFMSKPEYMREGLRFSKVQKRFANWNPDKYYDEFIRLKVPIFLVEQYERKGRFTSMRLTTNPCLKDYEFYKLFVPFIAFQEISMFISNDLCKPDDILEIDDKYVRDAKGFDEWSFKTRPNTKPNRKHRKELDDELI